MKISIGLKFLGAALLVCASVFLLGGCGKRSLAASNEAHAELTEEQRAVYGAFLDAISSAGFRNLTSTTILFDSSELGAENPCLRRIPDANFSSASSVHVVDSGLVKGRNMRIVLPQQQYALKESGDRVRAQTTDPQTLTANGFLQLSEVSFDKTHRFALVKYNFVCGVHCLTSQVYLMEKTDNQWRINGRPCTMVAN